MNRRCLRWSCSQRSAVGMGEGERGDLKLGFAARAFSAAGAAVLSAVIVNPLDVAKAAGVAYSHPLSNLTSRMACFGPNMMLPIMLACWDARYRFDMSSQLLPLQGNPGYAVQDCPEGRIWNIVERHKCWSGIGCTQCLNICTIYDIFWNSFEQYTTQVAPRMTPYVPLIAGSLARSLACVSCYPIELAKTRMQAFKQSQTIKKPPGVWKTLLEIISNVKVTNNVQTNLQSYQVSWTGICSACT